MWEITAGYARGAKKGTVVVVAGEIGEGKGVIGVSFAPTDDKSADDAIIKSFESLGKAKWALLSSRGYRHRQQVLGGGAARLRRLVRHVRGGRRRRARGGAQGLRSGHPPARGHHGRHRADLRGDQRAAGRRGRAAPRRRLRRGDGRALQRHRADHLPSLAQIASQRPPRPTRSGRCSRTWPAPSTRRTRGSSFTTRSADQHLRGVRPGPGIRITDFGAGFAARGSTDAGGLRHRGAVARPRADHRRRGGRGLRRVRDGAGHVLRADGALVLALLPGRPRPQRLAARAPGAAHAAVGPGAELGAVLSTGFDGLLGASLAVDPAQRFRSVGELAVAVESLVVSKGPETAATMAFPRWRSAAAATTRPSCAARGPRPAPAPAAGAPAQQPQMPQQMAPRSSSSNHSSRGRASSRLHTAAAAVLAEHGAPAPPDDGDRPGAPAGVEQARPGPGGAGGAGPRRRRRGGVGGDGP